jgi:hypothetical protein
MKTFSTVVLGCLTILLLLGAVSSSQGQVAYRIPFYIRDSINSGGAHYDSTWTLFLGVHPSGINGCPSDGKLSLNGFSDHWNLTTFYPWDNWFYDELPPLPPAFPTLYPFVNAGCGTMLNQVKHFNASTDIDTFSVTIVPADTPLYGKSTKWFSWPPPAVLHQYCDSMIIAGQIAIGDSEDAQARRQIRFDASQLTSYTAIAYPSSQNGTLQNQLLSFRIYVYHPKNPAIPSAPPVTMLTPAQGDTMVSNAPTFTWSPVAGTWRYHLQVSVDSTFKPDSAIAFAFNDSIPGSLTSKTLTGLKDKKKYYWQVYAVNEYGYSYPQTPRQWFRTKPSLNSPVPYSPANGATGIGLSPTLSWHSSASQFAVTYRVQVATDTSFSSPVYNNAAITDSSVTVPGPLQNCVTYYWRVYASDAQNPQTAWSTLMHFRTLLATPSVPSLSAPADNALNVTVSPTLSWTGDVCTDTYRLQVARDAAFTDLVVNAAGAAASRSVGPLDQDSTYYWRVQAYNSTPDSSGWTTPRSFRVILLPPSAPALLAPPNRDTTQAVNPSLRWGGVKNKDFYHLQLSTDSLFRSFGSDGVNDSSLTDTTRSVGPLANCVNYFWRVQAKNAAGLSAWSSSFKFRVATAVPGVVTLVSPPDLKDSVVDRITLRWQGDPCTYQYRYWVALTAGFTDTVQMGVISADSVVTSSLLGNRNYYWRVQALNYLGAGAYSPGRSFHTTFSLPDSPLLISPANNTTDLPMTVTFVWDSATFAAKYHFQLSFDATFTTLQYEDTSILRQANVRPSKVVSNLINSKTYYWRVRSKNDLGPSAWSASRQFATLYPPAQPSLVLPADGQKYVAIQPVFYWSVAQRADKYELVVAGDHLFHNVVADDTTLTETSGTVYSLTQHTTYYWHVRGKNAAGWGPWSDSSSFMTTWVGPARWMVPLLVSETGPERDYLYFGLNQSATNGIDASWDEYELPPVTPGMFDIRFVSPLIGQGLAIDIHHFQTYTQSDTFQFAFQPGYGSYPMTISWPAGFVRSACDSAVIVDKLISPTVAVRMERDSVLVISSPTISSLYIVTHGAFPVTAVHPEPKELPKGFVLSQNYPNPFNPSTHVQFSLDRAARVRLEVYDMLGRQMAVLARGLYPSGIYTFEWNGTGADGRPQPSGVYYVRLIASGIDGADASPVVQTRKMLMLK